jgi:hypothetical protein
MGLKVTNNAFGTLNAGINSSATTIVLTAGQGARFPTLSAGDYFYATLIDTSNNLEIVKVTARSTDTMTVVRGQDNTTARAYSTNDRFELRPTAALFNEKADAADVASTYLPLTGGAISGNVRVGGDAFGQPLRRVTVREDATDSSFKGLKVVNAGGGGAVAGVFLQGYDWVQGGIWHGRSATGTERDGALVLGTNPNTTDLSEGGLVGRIVIDNAGRVRMPYQPAFSATGGAGNVTISYPTAVTLSTTHFNRGSHYNTSTSKFTAPVAGVYQFNLSIYLNSTTANIVFLVNNAQIGGGDPDNLQFKSTDSPYTMAMSICTSLAANDTVSISSRDGSGNSTVYTGHTTFSGFLVG